jgi:hypothetical protein
MRTSDEHSKFLRCGINGNSSIEIASAKRAVTDENEKGGARIKRRPFAKLA